MNTSKEILAELYEMEENSEVGGYYQYLMLEIMCNIAITLDKIAKQGEPEIRLEEDKK